jgi:acyl carrier protein phosphodiesterase
VTVILSRSQTTTPQLNKSLRTSYTPWVDHVVSHADQDLPAGPGRWVRLAVGLAAEEYQLGNAELEAIERVRGGVGADRDSNLVTWLAQVDRRPRAELLGDGVVALVWLRAFGW